MAAIERLWDFVQGLTPLTRSCLLGELERLDYCGVEIPGSADIQAKLRAEFRTDGSQNSLPAPARLFFAPLEPLLVNGAPEHGNIGRIAKASLAPAWEWVCRDLLPTMARDYVKAVNGQAASKNDKEAAKLASAFHVKVIKVLENTLNSPAAIEQARSRLAQYTASPTTIDDVKKMCAALRSHAALAKFDAGLPEKIADLDDVKVSQITKLLEGLRKASPDGVPFALTLVARRLKAPWQLIRLATKAASTKGARDVAATPYAVAVDMVLDHLDNSRLALRIALKNNRVMVARELLAAIYDTEYALNVRIDRLEQCEWGARLQRIMAAISALVEAEVRRFPDHVGHIFASRRLRSYDSLAGRLTYLAFRGRDVLQDGALFCRKLIGQA